MCLEGSDMPVLVSGPRASYIDPASAETSHRVDLALDLERIEPLEDNLTSCAPLRLLIAQDRAQRCTTSPPSTDLPLVPL